MKQKVKKILYPIFSSLVQSRAKWQHQNKFLSTKGSSALILSVMVSGSVLATIFYSQKNIGWNVASQADVAKAWTDHFIQKYAMTLGSYLISNNIVLCRENGWKDHEHNHCKWNEEAQESKEDFHIISEEYTQADGEDKKTLKFTVTIQEESLNEGKQIKFALGFNLDNWKSSSVKRLIGEIPDSLCRDTTTLQIIPGTCSREDQQCKKPDGTVISNATCELISAVDQDYSIVLISSQIIKEQNQNTEPIQYVGIRRPLAKLKVEIINQPRCDLSCASSETAFNSPECRGDFQPHADEDTASLKVKVTNLGPGALYSLALLREHTDLTKQESDNDSEEDENSEDSTPQPTYSVTSNLMENAREEVILPEQSLEFDDRITCKDSVEYNFRRQSGSSTDVQVSMNQHAQSYEKMSYSTGYFQNPIGVCTIPNDQGQLQVIEGETCPDLTEAEHNKGNPNKLKKACGSGGTCRYAHVEPRKIISEGEQKALEKQVETLTTTVLYYVPPH